MFAVALPHLRIYNRYPLKGKSMTEEKKKFTNPFVEAAKKAAENRSVPGSKTTQVQQAKFQNKPQINKPMKKSAGRGR